MRSLLRSRHQRMRIGHYKTVGVLKRKKNWSAPGPEKLVNFWWKRAHALHEGVARSFEAISRIDDEYPSWLAEGKMSLIPKPAEFTSDNQRPITCLNSSCKWFTSRLLGPTDQHLEEDGHRGALRRAAVEREIISVEKITQRAVINIVFQRIFYIELDVSYASQHTFSKVPVTIFENYIYIVNIRGLEPRLRKMICSSTCLDIMSSNSQNSNNFSLLILTLREGFSS